MKKAFTFVTALAMTVMCSTLSTETTHAAEYKRLPVTSKILCVDQSKDCLEQFFSSTCFKIGAILRQNCNSDTPTLPDTPENEPAQSPSEDESVTSDFAKQVVALVNEERAKENLAPLSIDANIENAALVRANEIQTSFSHTRPDGRSFSTALQEAAVTFRSAGENIAWGQQTPDEVVTAWMNSAGHRANIMNANYSRIGVGHLQNTSGVSYWVQLFAN